MSKITTVEQLKEAALTSATFREAAAKLNISLVTFNIRKRGLGLVLGNKPLYVESAKSIYNKSRLATRRKYEKLDIEVQKTKEIVYEWNME